MIKWLSAAAGPELAVIGLLGALTIGGGSYVWGRVDGSKICEAGKLAAVVKLDEKSDELAIDTDKIADELKDKIDSRMSAHNTINTGAIENAAYRQGVLEGKAEGYTKGFKDAAEIPDSCYDDPNFLPDSLRVGAVSRYEAIFGGPRLAGENAKSTEVRGYPQDDVESIPPD